MARADAARLTPGAGRRFGFTVGAALLLLAAAAWWRSRETPALVFGALGAVLVVAGAVAPGRLGPVHAAWMSLGQGIAKITTPIILGAMYLVVVMPLGALVRLAGRNPLRHRARDDSYWTPVASGGRSDLDKQF
jgi:hypothetical protein